jgi:hypothetical protein
MINISRFPTGENNQGMVKGKDGTEYGRQIESEYEENV